MCIRPPFTKPPLRVTRLIQQETSGALTIHRLAQHINEANMEDGTGCTVNWRMLRNIRDHPGKVGLTWSILVALHTYFKRHGASLQHLPIIETRGVLEALGGMQRLVFMLGAKPRPEEQRTDLSRWDSLAYADLRAEASMESVERKSDIHYVLWRSPVEPAALSAEPWYRILEEDQASVISIGSPMAALSSEIMLSRMFGVKPFERPHFSTKAPLPFFFVWREKVAADFHSAFGVTSRELQPEHPNLAMHVKGNKATAFLLEKEVHETRVNSDEWTMYGVIAAQRRAAGNVWLVISGLAGPATYAAANMVKQITEELPWSVRGPSKVMWLPVRVNIRAGKPKPSDGDIREVVGAEFDGQPRFWPES